MTNPRTPTEDYVTLCLLFEMRKDPLGGYSRNGRQVVLLNDGEVMLYWTPTSSACVRCSSLDFLQHILEKEFGPLPPQIVDMDGIIVGE